MELHGLAQHYRKMLKTPVLAITGSNGKTTTKELINSVLGQKYKVQSTPGNLNNHIGVPLTLLSLNVDTEIAIIEMGANHPGEIRDLCLIALPQSGLITNIGKAHLDGFGNFEGVRRTKAELYEFIKTENGKIYLNDADSTLVTIAGNYSNTIRYNSENGICDAKIIASLPTLSIQVSAQKGITERLETKLYGDYNLPNILAAVAIGLDHSMSLKEIRTGIEMYSPDSFRSQVMALGNIQLILDCYNANPTSMELALTNFEAIDANRKIVVLGGMKELGMYEQEEHQKIGHLLNQFHFDVVILLGKEFEGIRVNKSHYFSSFADLERFIPKLNLNNSTLLIKGSRTNKLERLVDVIKEAYSSCN